MESFSLFGFVLGNQNHSFTIALPFFVISIALFLRVFPSEERMREWIETKNF